jgi:hypothetical protein
MANILLTIPDATVDRILDALAARHGYNPIVDGTKAQFAKKQLRLFLQSEVFAHEALVEVTALNTARKTEIETNIPIT